MGCDNFYFQLYGKKSKRESVCVVHKIFFFFYVLSRESLHLYGHQHLVSVRTEVRTLG